VNALTADLLRAADPVALARMIGMEADDWQLRVLRSRSRRIILNCCRQSGKTTVLAMVALHEALYAPGSLILIISATEKQGTELLRVIVAAYRVIGRPVDSEAESRLALELENGSRIICLPSVSSSIRGYAAVNVLLLDEASRIEDETFAAARPMLAVSNGRLLLASTPWARMGFFFEAWTSSTEEWERYEVTADEVPRISSEFLAKEALAMSRADFEREYRCVFGDLRSQVFREEDVRRMLDEEVDSWLI
jgi:hypothetical protein